MGFGLSVSVITLEAMGYGRISGAELVKPNKRISVAKLIFSPLWRSYRADVQTRLA